MAGERTSKPTIEYRHNVAKSQHEIGVRAGKLFVPFAVVPDSRYAQLIENAENSLATSEGDNGDDE